MVLPCLVRASLAADGSTDTAARNSLRAGAWALQFEVNDPLLNVVPLSGSVSLKRQFSPQSALRFGIGIAASTRTTNPAVDLEPEAETDEDAYRISLELLYQRYFNPGDILNVYVAAGPFGSAERRTGEGDFVYYRAEETTTSWTAGGMVALGGEWFFTRRSVCSRSTRHGALIRAMSRST
jgi:hypothetical protein